MLQLGAIEEIPSYSRGFSSEVLFLSRTERGKDYGMSFSLFLKFMNQNSPTVDLEEPMLLSIFMIFLKMYTQSP